MSIPLAPMVTRNAVEAYAQSALPHAPLVLASRRGRPVRASVVRGLRVAASALAGERRD
jgi:hypothetical protein